MGDSSARWVRLPVWSLVLRGSSERLENAERAGAATDGRRLMNTIEFVDTTDHYLDCNIPRRRLVIAGGFEVRPSVGPDVATRFQ
jgi:hypothetical protein